MKTRKILWPALVWVLMLSAHTGDAQQVLTLQQCLDKALSSNKSLEVDKQNIRAAAERKELVKSYRMPQLSLESDYKYFLKLPTQMVPAHSFNPMVPEGVYKEAQFGVPHNANLDLKVKMPLFNPQLKIAANQAELGFEMSGLKLRMTREDLIFRVSQLYYNAQIVKNKISFVQDNLKNAKDLRQTLALLKKHQLATGTEVDRVQLQIQLLTSKEKQLTAKYHQALNGLKMLLSIPQDSTIEVVKEVDFSTHEEPEPARPLALQIAETKQKMLEADLDKLHKSALPKLALFGSYGVTGYGYDKSPNEFLKFFTRGLVGIKATYDLYDGGRLRRQKSIKLTELEANRLRLDLIRDKTSMEIANARLAEAAAREQIQATKEQIAFAQKIYDKTVLLRKEGLASVTDILMADNEVRRVQQDYLDALIGYYQAVLQLQRALGVLSDN